MSGDARVFVDQAGQNGFSVDLFAVEVSNHETAVVFALADALGTALVRLRRLVVHLLLGQDGARVTEN